MVDTSFKGLFSQIKELTTQAKGQPRCSQVYSSSVKVLTDFIDRDEYDEDVVLF